MSSSDGGIILYLVVILITSGPTSAENRIWTTCEEDSECGPNEICQKATDLDLPCSKGLCACRPCYDIYGWSDTCTRPIYKTLYEECEEQEQEGVIYPQNARCSSSGYVECVEGYEDSYSSNFEKSCEKIGARFELPEDAKSCERNSECYGDLVCNNQFKCGCYFGHEKWDRQNKKCVKREYGDPCVSNDDCNVSGHNWQGFTYNSGACLEGRCECSPGGKALVVSYFEPGTGILKVKTICVTVGANANITRGSICTLDPIYNGDSPHAQICPTALVCYQCPEQYERKKSPFCRAVIPSPANPPNCYPTRRTTTPLPATTTKEKTPTISSDNNGQIISISGIDVSDDFYSDSPAASSPSYKVVDIGGGSGAGGAANYNNYQEISRMRESNEKTRTTIIAPTRSVRNCAPSLIFSKSFKIKSSLLSQLFLTTILFPTTLSSTLLALLIISSMSSSSLLITMRHHCLLP